jgi:hypothetical protein
MLSKILGITLPYCAQLVGGLPQSVFDLGDNFQCICAHGLFLVGLGCFARFTVCNFDAQVIGMCHHQHFQHGCDRAVFPISRLADQILDFGSGPNGESFRLMAGHGTILF